MNTYKNTHFTHYRAVLEHFLKVGEARLYKLFKFARFGACTSDDNGILKRQFLENGLLESLKSIINSINGDQ